MSSFVIVNGIFETCILCFPLLLVASASLEVVEVSAGHGEESENSHHKHLGCSETVFEMSKKTEVP